MAATFSLRKGRGPYRTRLTGRLAVSSERETLWDQQVAPSGAPADSGFLAVAVTNGIDRLLKLALPLIALPGTSPRIVTGRRRVPQPRRSFCNAG